MNQRDLWENSAEAWIALMEQGDRSRTLILDEPMLRLAGDVRGLSVGDVGCGEGRFCRMLAARGASCVGVDPTEKLIGEARRQDPSGRYLLADAESLPLESGRFDLVVSYLVLLDIADYRTAIREMVRITKPGGRILVANMNSFCSTREIGWERDADGKNLHVAVDNYLDERSMVVAWRGIEIVNYHRPFDAYIRPFLDAELKLTDFEEPKPTNAAVADYPAMADALRVPFFHVMQWRKDVG